MIEQLSSDSQDKLIVFGAKQIRRLWVDDQWYFSIVDIIAALTDSDNPRDYWYRMKHREKASSGFQLSTLCRQLKLTSADGKSYKTEAVNTEAAFRIIQSIPSPKAEPFKRWLAQVGYERVQEIENLELAEQKGRAFAIPGSRDTGASMPCDFAILTSEISKATFGVTPADYKKLKVLKRENLRDHMTDLELIFTMLGEAATTEIARNKNAQGFTENQVAARDGGTVAGDARR